MSDLGCGKEYMTLKCRTIRIGDKIVLQELCEDCSKLKDAKLGERE